MVVTRLTCARFGLSLAQCLFGSVAFLDVDSGSVPIHDVSHSSRQRHVADQQPPIIPVRPPHPCFTLQRFPSRHRCVPLVDIPRESSG